MSDVLHLSAQELKRLLDEGGPLALLDVREDDERAYCALPAPKCGQDLHVPMDTIPAALEDLRSAAESLPLVVYCHHGVRSMAVARWLVAKGMEGVHNLDGGIDAWSTQVDIHLPRY